jgi:hypothetical protein
MAVWAFTSSNSWAVSLPGLRRIGSGTPILPTSCSGAVRLIRFTSRSLRLRPAASSPASFPTRWMCPPVASSRYSVARASRSSTSLRASSSSRVRTRTCASSVRLCSCRARWRNRVSRRLRMRRVTSCASNGLVRKSLAPPARQALFGLEGRVGGEDEDGEVLGRVDPRREPAQELHAIEVRHVQVQQHEVGTQLVEHRLGPARVGHGPDLVGILRCQDAPQEQDVRLLIVDDQEARSLDP